MTRNKMYLFTLLAAGTFALCSACNDKVKVEVNPPDWGSGETPAATSRIVSKVTTRNDRTFVRYKNQPYLMYGIQIRFDDFAQGYSRGFMEENFQKAAEAGFRTVCVPVGWNKVEPTQDNYDFSVLGDMISLGAKYDLNIHLLWFGVNACGWALTVPSYIWNDRTTYPRHPEFQEQTFDLSNPNMLERIDKMAVELSNYLADNDPEGVIALIQVENETDNADGYNTNWSDHADVARKGFSGGQREAVFEVINRFGATMRSGRQRMVTRHNFTRMPMLNLNYAGVLPQSIAVPGLDIVGVDNYAYTSADQNRVIDFMEQEIPSGNVTHIPETNPHIFNTANLLMEAFARGCGVILYELRTSSSRSYDLGFYRKSDSEWIRRNGTQQVPMLDDGKLVQELDFDEIAAFNKMIYKASGLVASLPKERIAAFNVENAAGPYIASGVTCGDYALNYASPTGGEAMALCDMSDNLVLLSLHDAATFSIDGKQLSGEVSVGYFDATGNFVEESKRAVQEGKVVLNTAECAVIKAEDIL